MRLKILLAVAALLSGCDEQAKTFGHSYDECVLKNTSGTAAQAALAEPSCRRRFEVKSVTGSGADPSATIKSRGSQRWIDFTISNTDASKIITAISADAVFLGKDDKEIATLTWTFSTFIEPDKQVELTGVTDKPWPSTDFVTRVTVTREIPIKR